MGGVKNMTPPFFGSKIMNLLVFFILSRLVHNLLMHFVTLGSSKIEVFKTCFFDIVTT